MTQDTVITHFDRHRLQGLVRVLRQRSKVNPRNLDALEQGLQHARTVPADAIPSDVVTMNSKFTLRNAVTGERSSLTLVFPEASNHGRRAVSVLSPLGMALLGSRAGDTLELGTTGTSAPLTIERIEYQPEAGGNYYM